MKHFLIGFFAFIPFGLIAQERPNIVLLYMDDWAWNGTPVQMDSSMPNSAAPILEMPNVERLAEEGMIFTNAYGSHQCAPARACVQTGQSGPRNGLTLVLGKTRGDYYDERPQYSKLPMIPNIADPSLDLETENIPRALKKLGYASAHLGKWHLYTDPGEAGFDVHDGETTNKEGNTVTTRNLPADMTDPKLMVSMTDKALAFMQEQVEVGKPFFLQISHYAMHAGPETLRATQEKYEQHPRLQAFYEAKGTVPDKLARKSNPANWYGMGEDMDTQIGRVLDKLDQLGILENTYVVLVSDNGYRHGELLLEPGYTQPLHGHKWWLWQGGIRVPMIAKGPGIPAGTIFDGNVINYDFLPTFVDWAGGDPSQLKDIDGVSLKPYMEGQTPDAEFLNRNLYFHCPHYRSEVPHSAVISGNAKVMHFYEQPDLPMLFNLEEDPGETTNVAKQFPEAHQRLHGEMMEYLNGVDARFPKDNPNYDPEYYKSTNNYNRNIQLGPFDGTRPAQDDEI